jgi:hypothetical protein
MDATISFTLANDKHAFVVALNPPAAGGAKFPVPHLWWSEA